MNNFNIKKTFIENYKQYSIYKIQDANGRVLFNAESVYMNDGFITFVANSTNEIYKKINKQIQLLQFQRKSKIWIK